MPQATATATAITYRPEIDGLRALAVILVILFHAGLGFPGGYVGVDVFFVISGFLITSLLMKDLDAGRLSLVAFYERRARRILPASLAVTAVVLVAGYFTLLPLDLERLGASAVAHALCCANIFFWRSTNYFGGSAESMPLLHMWSLAVEEQFYFVFPVLLIVCYRFAGLRSRGALMSMVGAVLLCSLGLSVYAVHTDSAFAFFMLPTRAWELMIGSMLALLPTIPAPRAVREFISLIGAAAIVLPALLYSPDTLFPGIAALPPCVGAGLLIGSCRGNGAQRQTFIGRLLSHRVPVFIGGISYSLYLCHWPILVFAKYWRLVPLTAGQRWLAVLASVVAALLLWRLIELPFHRRRVCVSRRAIFTAAAGAIVMIAIGGAVFDIKGGLPTRFSDKVNEFDAIRRQQPHLAQLQAGDVTRDALIPFGDQSPGLPVSILLWGDSHAGVMQPVFDDVCKTLHVNGRAATHSSTAPLLDYASDTSIGMGRAAVDYNRAVVEYVGRHQVKTVFLVNYWRRDEEHDAVQLAAALGRTIGALNQLGATVYVMLQIPDYSVDVPKALAYEAIQQRPSGAWRKSVDDFRREQAAMISIGRQYESPMCHFIDPAAAFQRRGEPYLAVTDHGRSLYRDQHHLTAWGAKRMLDGFIEKAIMATRDQPPAG